MKPPGRAGPGAMWSRLLNRLYPAEWRARHGAELAMILADRPPGPFESLDLLRGALDAHIRARSAPDRVVTRMRVVPRTRVVPRVVLVLLAFVALGLNYAMVVSILSAAAVIPDRSLDPWTVALITSGAVAAPWLVRRMRAPRPMR